MHFRCPNCEHHIAIVEEGGLEDPTVSELTCPTCQSKVSLAGDDEETIVPTEGVVIGGFQIREVLGQGSFGLVYKAWDEELRRFVAVKIPRPGRITSRTAAQFLREARSAAGIQHSNIVSVLEIGQHDNVYYIATEFIDGVTLSEWLKFHQLTPDEAATLMIRLCDAMQAAHERNMIHRDLKPGNVLIDQQGEPHITDFGLAKRVSPDELTVTEDGHVVGTPAYMSPEQARGENRKLTPRSDVYSLGIIFYEMLTGKKPFTASDSGTMIYRILTEEPTPPRALRPDLHRDLNTICLCAIHKDPARRYESAAAFAADLRNHLQDRPIKARRVSIAEKSWKLIRRNKIVTALVALLLLAVAIPMMMPEQIPDGYVRVRITTNPVADWVRFVPYHRSLRTPNTSSAVVTTDEQGTTILPPGLYRVAAGDEEGRFHEVWRFVDDTQQDSIENMFRHRMWTVGDDGTVELPGFRIFRDDEVKDDLVLLPGGDFEVGYDPDPNGWNGKHVQPIPDLLVGRDEVSVGQFREVMQQPVKLDGSSPTFLEMLQLRYGPRDSVSKMQPVTGFPVDVAILYCELAGGRLPTSVEWEFLAVLNEQPATDSPRSVAAGQLDSVGADATATPGAAGLKHTAGNAAEFTDSISSKYANLYPEFFPEEFRARSEQVRSMLETMPPAAIEVRGGSAAFVQQQSGSTDPVDEPGEQAVRFSASPVRNRLAVPVLSNDLKAAQTFGRISWRLVRSAERPRSAEWQAF